MTTFKQRNHILPPCGNPRNAAPSSSSRARSLRTGR
ncbi:hypothetical protein E2C01_027518 [Portunus trituberculatus]|uniref:Uncharacterized protein n=1 Tax=Portunus trituberculatus TaxID=210409 RepID=A0A5B7ELU8_PORTR|nr:hypothetical protein [Portunus trituberculatus]